MQSEPKYWFPAKRYGWGWGLPSTWQGIAVLVLYIGLLAVGGSWLRADRTHGEFLLYALGLTALLVLVCWLKGEPPGQGRRDRS